MLGANWDRRGLTPNPGSLAQPQCVELEEDGCSGRLTPQKEPVPTKSPQPNVQSC